ncbi:hypothetical protein [Thermofilum sp.]|uniref:hypothetical protein n=1 Tax=Thermofilum sp. TaxID=1961369 RepID=UPI0031653BF6
MRTVYIVHVESVHASVAVDATRVRVSADTYTTVVRYDRELMKRLASAFSSLWYNLETYLLRHPRLGYVALSGDDLLLLGHYVQRYAERLREIAGELDRKIQETQDQKLREKYAAIKARIEEALTRGIVRVYKFHVDDAELRKLVEEMERYYRQQAEKLTSKKGRKQRHMRRVYLSKTEELKKAIFS